LAIDGVDIVASSTRVSRGTIVLTGISTQMGPDSWSRGWLSLKAI